MSIWFYLFLIVLCLSIFLILKIIIMKNEINNIAKSISSIINADTNNLITVSSNDKELKRLATSLNKSLKNLRKLELEYKNGNQELKSSITNISHDLRTPLTAIRGYLDLMDSSNLDSKQIKYLSIIDSKVKDLTSLTEQLFDFSKSLDIQKTIEYKNAIVFLEDIKMLNKSNQYFMFGKESTIIIKASKENLEKMRYFQEIDLYEILKQIYKGQEVLLSNWVKADYMTQDREYIILMPFIDTEKLHKLNIFYNNNKNTNRKIDIITLRENKEKIDEILTNRTNIIEIDNLLGGIDGESKKV